MPPLRDLIDTWASFYSNSAALRSGIAFVHMGGLVAGGGCAVAADLATLRAFRRGREAVGAEIARLHDVHRIVIGSLLLVMASGLLLMLADVDAYLSSTAFWIKMALVAALVANGGLLTRAGNRATDRDPRSIGLMRIVSLSSLALWFATTLVGATLPNVL